MPRTHQSIIAACAPHIRSPRRPLGREGLVILALRKLHRQPCCGVSVPSRSP